MSSFRSNALPPPGLNNNSSSGSSNNNNSNSGQQQQPNLNVSYHTVTIQRDYSDIVTKFEKEFPNELQSSGITQDQFEYTISRINQWLEKAETVDSTNIIEEFFGCITFFSIFLCYDDKYKKIIKSITQFIQEQNETVYQGRGVTLVNPMGNGFLKFEILIKYTSDPFSSGTTSPSSNTTTAVTNTQFSLSPSSIPSSSHTNTPIVSESVNNNNNNNNNNNKSANNSQFYNSNKTYPVEEKVIQKPETVLNINTNSHVVELSDDSDDDADESNSDFDADEAHYSSNSEDQGSDQV
ncbi:hypothetical protein CYY_007879 [Polysphondylium violaceum]|uniref:Ras modification protein ERF4 n=1 Tax=Polysphondylium violaceum TaxID=133409 RepID=A0A8J4PWJ8_9MYCE|nr:hypothetical protein CYY_007879 [Polysphondylium violaceum]